MRRYLTLLVGVLGLLEFLFPRAAVELFTRYGLHGNVPPEPKRWLVHAARLEGAILAALAFASAYRGGRSSGSTTEPSDVTMADWIEPDE